MTTQRLRAARGVTLVELMVASALGAIVMAGVSGAFIAQAREYQSQAGRRLTQSSSRSGVAFIEDKVRLAGYGVDPNLAISVLDSWDPASSALAAGVDFPDALIVHQRNLGFQRGIIGATPTQIILNAPLAQDLPRGTIVLALCPAANPAVYAVVTSRAVAGSTNITVGTPGNTVSSPVLIPTVRWDQSATLADACFARGEAVLVKIDRHAFFINSYNDDGRSATPEVPYLMVHRGTDLNNDGTVDILDAQPVAVGVEQLQVALVMNSLPTSAPSILGVTAATRIPDPTTWDTAATRPGWEDTYTHAKRYMSNPANIRQVRFTLVSRGEATASGGKGGDKMMTSGVTWNKQVLGSGVTAWTQLENLSATPNPKYNPNSQGYVRTVMRTAVAPKNLMMRTQFLPPHTTGG